MSTSASRQVRSARNALIEALGLGETFPLRDLPISVEPPVVPFGGKARLAIDDSERAVIYRLLDQEGQSLPQGVVAEITGTGGLAVFETPAIAEDATFMLGATRSNGRTTLLFERASVKVGLDADLAVAVTPTALDPLIVDHGAVLEIEVGRSQEGVTYRLVGRPVPDPAAADDAGAVAADIALSAGADINGTGGAIRLPSIPLVDDITIHVRASKAFGGRIRRATQTVLLTRRIRAHVRADIGPAITIVPPVVDHAGSASLEIAGSQAGVRYTVHARPVADAEFSRALPPPADTIAVATAADDVRITAPAPGTIWALPPGFIPVGAAVAGTGAGIGLPLPALIVDQLLIVEAEKRHGSEPSGFVSAERLATVAGVLVRPDPQPALVLAAVVVDGALVRVTAVGGQPGVFYLLSAAGPLGELYCHQVDPGDGARNKGVGAIAVSVDFVVAEGVVEATTAKAPPPRASLDLAPLALPLSLNVTARRAQTSLTSDCGRVAIALPATVSVEPKRAAAGAEAKVTIAPSDASDLHVVLVDGKPVADPVPGNGGALVLGTGSLARNARVVLALTATRPGPGIGVVRWLPLAIEIGS